MNCGVHLFGRTKGFRQVGHIPEGRAGEIQLLDKVQISELIFITKSGQLDFEWVKKLATF